MVSFPPCKINLGLQITDKRADGYHNLVTCFYPVQWTDVLEVIAADHFSFTSTGDEIQGLQEENLCVRAYALLQEEFNLQPVNIHLHKIIPTGAGLGGGSSDAAHMLRLLNSIFQLNLSQEKLMTYAARLGSDCSFFIQDGPMMATGRGEILSPVTINMRNYYLVIVKPDIHVSTAEAYAGIRPRIPPQSLADTVQKDVSMWHLDMENNFEESVFEKYPGIREIKEKLYARGALYASMSGSGAALYGIFREEIDLKETFAKDRVWSAPMQ